MDLFGSEEVIEQDAPPEVIADDSLVEPRAMPYCLGHEQQEKLFLELFEKNTIPHAMIFSGSQGIGKSTMAFRLARFLLKHGRIDNNQDSLFGGEVLEHDISSLDVAPNDPVFSQIASGGHADLLYIHRHYDSTKGKFDAALKVDSLRKIEPFLRKTSSQGGWRIVIIDDADTMNRNAQNAILKILEEPPSNVLIILIAHRAGMLIPTIRSRSRNIEFSKLSHENMNELLTKQGHSLSFSELETIAALSEGSIGQALRFAEGGGLETLSTIIDLLNSIPNWNWVKIHHLSASLASPSQDKDYRMFIELLQWVFRKLLFAKARGDTSPPNYLQRGNLQKIMNENSLEKLISISDGLKNHFESVDFSNLDRRDAVRGAFLVINQ